MFSWGNSRAMGILFPLAQLHFYLLPLKLALIPTVFRNLFITLYPVLYTIKLQMSPVHSPPPHPTLWSINAFNSRNYSKVGQTSRRWEVAFFFFFEKYLVGHSYGLVEWVDNTIKFADSRCHRRGRGIVKAEKEPLWEFLMHLNKEHKLICS